MKKKKITVVASILFGVLLTVFAVLSTSAYSDSDPLITLSYLEEIFAPSLKEEIIEEVSSMTPTENEDEYVPTISDSEQEPESVDNTESAESIGEQQANESNSYTLLELSLGQTVMANSICEFIVRPGSRVAAITPFPSQGIADITNGVEVLSGETISINAYCLIPRGADGRGLSVLSEKAYIMIRGDYTIG